MPARHKPHRETNLKALPAARPLRVLVAPDKFKGTLTARAAAAAIARGWRRARPEDTLELLPASDGGDGFGAVMSALLGARPRVLQTMDAAHRPLRAMWWWDASTGTAIIESAQTIGMALLPQGTFHPFQLDTFGLGAVLAAARKSGAKHFLIGIGGSATNDGGFGLARALGWRFLDDGGHEIAQWTGLTALRFLHPPTAGAAWKNVVVAVDVQNPLLGPRGATRVYGPQKGLRAGDFAEAEACLKRLAGVVRRGAGANTANMPGAGAAGGLGFGLRAFLGARLEGGFLLFAQQADLERRIRAANLVITGEGALDASSFMGKCVGGIAARCGQHGRPCIALAGMLAGKDKRFAAGTTRSSRSSLAMARGIVPDLASSAEALARPAFWLAELARRAAEGFSRSPALAACA